MIRKEQINRLFTGYVSVLALSVNGTSVNAAAAITTAVSTAGYNGGAVSLTNSSNETTDGLIISGNNRVEVYLSSTGKPIYYAGEKVYGRLTYPASVYTISLYYNLAGVQTAYNTGGATNLDFFVPYRFKFKDLSTDFFIMPKQNYLYYDFNNTVNQGRIIEEALTVSAPNVVGNLTYTPTTATKVTLFVNGKAETNVGATPEFTMSGNVITWSAANAGYSLATTDEVIAHYQTLQ